MVVFFTRWSLFAATLSSMSRGFKNLVQAFVTPIFWLSGIMYDVGSIDVIWIQKAMLFNPVSYFASGYRNTFIYETWIWEERAEFICFMVMLVVMVMACHVGVQKNHKGNSRHFVKRKKVENVISLDHVTKIYKLFKNDKKRFLATFIKSITYKEKMAINDVTFSVKRGEAVALLGA